jgi:dienelactone hydrolase
MHGILLIAGWLLLNGAQGPGAAVPPPYQTIFYTSDGLRLEAYLFKPEGAGPFPLVLYNHGSRIGDERQERPVPHIARLLVPLGYAVLVPERRGYGKSEGRTFTEEIGSDRGDRFVARLEAESRDALAAVDYVTATADAGIDAKRMAMVGWSFGGMVTTLAMGRDKRFAAGAVQAPAAANWIDRPIVQAALLKAARQIRSPLLCAVAENDTQTESTRAICAAVRGSGIAADVKIYPPFTAPPPAAGVVVRPPGPNAPAPGHAIFGPAGVALWGDDLAAFLRKYLPPTG